MLRYSLVWKPSTLSQTLLFTQSDFVSFISQSLLVIQTDLIQSVSPTHFQLVRQILSNFLQHPCIFWQVRIFFYQKNSGGIFFFHKKGAKIFSFLKAINSRQRKEYGFRILFINFLSFKIFFESLTLKNVKSCHLFTDFWLEMLFV